MKIGVTGAHPSQGAPGVKRSRSVFCMSPIRRATHNHVLLDFVAYPKAINRKPTPKEVPSEIKEHYEEAPPLLPFSSKASAALSRRCLQSILRSHGYTQQDLAKQIDAL